MNRFYGTIRSYTGPALSATSITVYDSAAGTALADLYDADEDPIANPTTTSARGIIDVYATDARLWFKVAGDTLVQPLTRVRGLSNDDLDANDSGLLLTRDEDNGSIFNWTNTADNVNGYLIHLTNQGHGGALGIGEGTSEGNGETDGFGLIIDEYGHGTGLIAQTMDVSTDGKAVVIQNGLQAGTIGLQLNAWAGHLGYMAVYWHETHGLMWYIDHDAHIVLANGKAPQCYTCRPLADSYAGVHAAVALTESTQHVTTAITNPDIYRDVLIRVTLGGGSSLAGDVVVTGTDWAGRVITKTVAVTAGGTYYTAVPFRTVASFDLPVRAQAGDTIALGFGNHLGLPIPPSSGTDVISQEKCGAADASFIVEAVGSCTTGTNSAGATYTTVTRSNAGSETLRWGYSSPYLTP